MRIITRADLKEKMEGLEDLKLVFTLGEWQYRAMHIPGPLNIPCSPSLFALQEGVQQLKPDDEIVVYCSNDICYASISVYYFLTQRGFKNVSRYAGGLEDWYEAGYPLAGNTETASGRPGASP